jgi:hypothetical protein
MVAPTVYLLHSPLLPTPVPTKELEWKPVLPPSDDSDDESNNGKPLTDNQRAEAAHKHEVFQESRPGPIPDNLGVIFINKQYEHDNFFHGAILCHYYFSACANMVYSGNTAIAAAEADHTGRVFIPPTN